MEALHWKRLEDGRAQCRLCPHGCILAEGDVGRCRARAFRAGKLSSEVYGKIAAIQVDPIEKKPLYHFYPGKNILSIGMNGCNLSCAFCQNWHMSQERVPVQDLSVTDLVAAARSSDSVGVAYTYSEPLVAFEYVLEASKACASEGLKNVLVTNGYILQEPLEELLPHVHAANVDLKGIRDAFYQRLCGARVQPVQQALKTMKGRIHLEITNLLVTGENDSEEDVNDLVAWVADELGEDTPLHLSRYFPQYKLTQPATPLSTLQRAYEQATRRLKFVYLGNARLQKGSDTVCPSCGATVIRRRGYDVDARGTGPGGRCKGCGERVVMGE